MMRTCTMPFIMVVGMFVVVGVVMAVETKIVGVFIIVISRLVLCECFGRNGARVGFFPCTACEIQHAESVETCCMCHARGHGRAGSVGESVPSAWWVSEMWSCCKRAAAALPLFPFILSCRIKLWCACMSSVAFTLFFVPESSFFACLP
jgi:hypothetical protein